MLKLAGGNETFLLSRSSSEKEGSDRDAAANIYKGVGDHMSAPSSGGFEFYPGSYNSNSHGGLRMASVATESDEGNTELADKELEEHYMLGVKQP